MEETNEVLVMTTGDNPMGSAIKMMQEMALATVMGTHERLGFTSVLRALDPDVLRREICAGLLVTSLTQVYVRTGLEWLVGVREMHVPFPLMQACSVVNLVRMETEGFVLQVCTASVARNAQNEQLKWEVSVYFDEIEVAAGGATHVEIPKSAMRVKTNAVEMQESFNLSDDAVELMVSPLWGVVYGDSGREIQMHGGQWGLYCMNLLLDHALPGVTMSSYLGMYVQNLMHGDEEMLGTYEMQDEPEDIEEAE